MISRMPAPPDGETLADVHPEVALEWNFEKNYPLTPDLFTRASDQKVWWKCSSSQSHEWPAVIKNRTLAKSGCPFCYRQNKKIK